MKISLNNIFTIILIIIGFVFASMWHFKETDYKKKLKESDKKILEIEKIRDSLKLCNKKLEMDFIEIQNSMFIRDKKIELTEEELRIIKKDLRRAEVDAELKRERAEESKKRIKKLKENPIKREGDELINSISEKLKN